jgi:hypothetical protein
MSLRSAKGLNETGAIEGQNAGSSRWRLLPQLLQGCCRA